MYAYIKALIDSDYEEEKTAITQAIGTKDIIECEEIDTEELGFKSPVTWGKMDYFSFIIKEFVRMWIINAFTSSDIKIWMHI